MGNETPKLSKEGHPKSIKDFELLYAKERVSKHNQGSLDEGICRGMCYDWIRLMLHGRGKQFISYQGYGSQKIQRIYSFQTGINKLFLQGADRRIQSLVNRSRALNRMNQDQLGPQYHLARERARQAALAEKQMRDLLPILSGSGFLAPQDLINLQTALSQQTRIVDLRIDRMTGIDDLIKKNLASMELIGKQIDDDETNFGHYYDYFQSHFDTLIKTDYGFDNIFFERGRYFGWAPKDLKGWLSEVRTYISQLRKGCCGLFNLRGKKSGHFIAFHRENTRFSLFDPNTGWYQIDGATNVWKMFVDLWYCAYLPFGYNKSTWRVFFKMEAPLIDIRLDPNLPLGHAFL